MNPYLHFICSFWSFKLLIEAVDLLQLGLIENLEFNKDLVSRAR